MFPFSSNMMKIHLVGVIYRSQLSSQIEKDLNFHLRRNLARYDEFLWRFFENSPFFDCSKTTISTPPQKLIFFIRFFSKSDAVMDALHDGNLVLGLVLYFLTLNFCEIEPTVCNRISIKIKVNVNSGHFG